MSKKAKIFLILVCVLQAGLGVRIDKGTQKSFAPSWRAMQVRRVLPPLRALVLLSGFRVAAGHGHWIHTVQYYGNTDNAKTRYRKILDFCHAVTDLNPHFLPAYSFGTAVLAFHVERLDEASELLKKGIRFNPHAERLALLAAAVSYRYTDQYERLVPILESEILTKNPSPMLVNILANVYKKLGLWEKRARLLLWLSKNADAPEKRKEALEELYQLRREGKVRF